MKQVIFDKSGRVRVKDVPVPEIGDNELLVKNAFSVLSAGTEKSMISLMKKPLWKMALDRPDLTRQVLDFAKSSGVKKTMDVVKSRLDVWHLLGYSSAGTVVKAGKNAAGFGVGDRVACIGSGFANHAEYVAVPKTFAAKIPKGLKFDDAAFSGIGCIALQSIRQLEPQLGENIVVIGLGLIGQMVAQLLRANGCRVIGIDIDREKTGKSYIDVGITKNTIKNVMNATDGAGADGVIIAASSKKNLVNDAFDMCRKKGRVVLLGICNLDIDRQKMFEKELDFKISTAFGAGSLDQIYEQGKDYPIEYARWTSGRNLRAVLELLSTKKLDISEMKKDVFDISDAKTAYSGLEQGKMMTALLRYNPKDEAQTIVADEKFKKTGKINVAIIGAGQFVKGFILPAIKNIKEFSLYAIATKSGPNAKKLAREHGAKIASTSYADIINDKNVDLVIIGTRHDSHAEIAAEALKKGKHVFSEKPMAIDEKSFQSLVKEIRKTAKTYACGFNRRYSPVFKKIKSMLSDKSPMMVNYVFNNTFLPADHWVNQPDVGGGRVIGEACHILDIFNFLTGSKPVTVQASKLSSAGGNDDNNISAVIKYQDGSVCTLTYSCIGSSGAGRESCTIIQDANTIEMSSLSKIRLNGKTVYAGKADEGHEQEMKELAAHLAGKESSLVTAEECITATETTFGVVKSAKGSR